jgi:hypothetical protein
MQYKDTCTAYYGHDPLPDRLTLAYEIIRHSPASQSFTFKHEEHKITHVAVELLEKGVDLAVSTLKTTVL